MIKKTHRHFFKLCVLNLNNILKIITIIFSNFFQKLRNLNLNPTFNPLKLTMPQNSHAHYENLRDFESVFDHFRELWFTFELDFYEVV